MLKSKLKKLDLNKIIFYLKKEKKKLYMRLQMRFHVSFFRKPFIAAGERALMRLFACVRHYMGFQCVSAAEGSIANFAFERPDVKMPF